MSMSKYIDFDLYQNRMRVQTQRQAFQWIALKGASFCGVKPDELEEICQDRFEEAAVSGDHGISIFDARSALVKKPFSFLITFDQDVDLNAHDGRKTDVLAGLISPLSDGAAHLQKLASIARLLRDQDLRAALREASSQDELKVLFMPTQDWIRAA